MNYNKPILHTILFLLFFINSACVNKRFLSDLNTDYTLDSGMSKGYLAVHELPNSKALLPPPPAEGSKEFELDLEMNRKIINQYDSARIEQAIEDANLVFPESLKSFTDIIGFTVNSKDTPYLFILLKRASSDVLLSTYHAKKEYQRARPFTINGESTCIENYEEALVDGSYPSGHAAVGMAWSLILSELVPLKANQLLFRGKEFGESRLVCNVHWHSDIEGGRFMGAATVARLHGSKYFLADLEIARKEVSALIP